MTTTSQSATHLIAILLVAQSSTKSEPRLIFHYPPKPGEDNARLRNILKEPAAEEDSSTSENDEDASDELSPAEEAAPSPKASVSPPDFEEVGSASPDTKGGLRHDPQDDKWNRIFDQDPRLLAKLLAPGQVYHKRRVEIGIDGKVFVGKPYYVNEDGSWRKPRKRRSSSKSTNQLSMLDSVVEEGRMQAPDESLTDIKEELGPEASSTDDHEEQDISPTVVKQSKDDSKKLDQVASNMPSKTTSSLKMFSLIFVLDPPPLEYHQKVNEMYTNVIKKLAKALRWEQARSDYVGQEVSSIVSVTKKFKMTSVEKSKSLNPLYHDLWSTSPLVKQLCSVYNTITTSRTAHITINTSSLSLQLPIPASLESIPSVLDHPEPGAWLSTAPSMILDHEAQNGTGSQLSAHFGLLLLVDQKSIIADIKAAQAPFLDSMMLYLETSKPTKSFLQVAKLSKLSLQDIQVMASHLIFWKKGRAVPPLNQRDTYIVSPNADMSQLHIATSAFTKAFPSFPSLPKTLSLLSPSSTLKPFSSLIPSKDHKEGYMNILAWLMRGGWVTQLRSFAWIRVPAHILPSPSHEVSTIAETNVTASQSKPDPPLSTNGDLASHSSSLSSTATTIHRPPAPPAQTSSLKTSKSTPTSPSIIPNPRLATPEQSRYLSAISRHILATQGEESAKAWDNCVHFFDGRHGLESMAVVQGWKKRKTEELVAGWEGLGVLVRVRHW